MGWPIIELSDSLNYREAIKEQIALMMPEGMYPFDIQFIQKCNDSKYKDYVAAAFIIYDDLKFPIKLDESDDISNWVTTGNTLPKYYDSIRLTFSPSESTKIRYERSKKS
ncbi:MAG: hypothetical protein WC979_02985 [Candidatus Pacearchaeota archaeon]|nr:hypothetical protein [Clostridia bacterium]